MQTTDMERTFDEFTPEEARRAAYSEFLPFIVMWLEDQGIQAGSTAFYCFSLSSASDQPNMGTE